MKFLYETDWVKVFWPEMSLLEIFVRGTLVYVAICLLLRIILKRQAGKVGLSDLLVVTIIAGICRNPLVKDAYSITDGLLVVIVVLAWSYAFDWLSYYVPSIHLLLHPVPVVLIQDGVVQKENLRHELVTESQLCAQLRRHGLQMPEQVAQAILEGSGRISVIPKKENVVPLVKEDATPSADGPVPCFIAPINGKHSREKGEAEQALDREESADMERFLWAVEQLRKKVVWHEQQIAEHREAVAELKRWLTDHGIRWKAVTKEPPR